MSEISVIRNEAISIATLAGNHARKNFGKPMKILNKGKWDIVTDVDLECQKLITQEIRKKFPRHGLLVEEEDNTLPKEKKITWIIDPIDGSLNFSKGQPIYAISIGVAIGDELVVGVIYDPTRDEIFSAVQGQGFSINQTQDKIKLDQVSQLCDSVLATDWNADAKVRMESLNLISKLHEHVLAINILGSAALALAWIAAGRLDGYFNGYLDVWDIAAGGLMIKEAGGNLTHFSGEEWNLRNPDRTCLASHGTIHSALEAIVRKN